MRNRSTLVRTWYFLDWFRDWMGKQTFSVCQVSERSNRQRCLGKLSLHWSPENHHGQTLQVVLCCSEIEKDWKRKGHLFGEKTRPFVKPGIGVLHFGHDFAVKNVLDNGSNSSWHSRPIYVCPRGFVDLHTDTVVLDSGGSPGSS